MIPIVERFWSKVKKTSGCWIWTAAKRGDKRVYGLFRIGAKEGNVAAHRFSYELKYGTIPIGKLVCHNCDNPSCVNPAHLFLGTHQDNAIDREKKKRSKTHGAQKLNARQARLIKSSSLSQTKLAKKFKVSRTTIASIRKGKTWKSV